MGAPLDLDQPFSTDPVVAGAGRLVHRSRDHPVLVGTRRAHRVADRPAHARDDRAARPVRDGAVQAVQAARRHHRRRSRRGPQARALAALHDQHRRARARSTPSPGAARTPCCRAPRTTGPGASATSTTPGRPPSTRTPSCSPPCPGNEPRPGDRWVDADLYWSGTGAMPRSAQHGAAAIHLYAPAFARQRARAARDVLVPAVHARLLPDRAVRRGAPGRQLDPRASRRRLRGAVVVASDELADARPGGHVHQRADRAVRPRRRGRREQRLDRRGRRRHARGRSFDALRPAVARRRPIEVTDLGVGPTACPQGFDVSYTSPTEGRLRFVVDRAVHGRRRRGAAAPRPTGSTTRSAPRPTTRHGDRDRRRRRRAVARHGTRWTRHAEIRRRRR